MNNSTPLFPNFHLQTLRRKPRSAQQILAAQLAKLKRKTFSQLGECLGKFIPTEYLRPTASGPLSRRRVFSKENTFWAFFSQVLGADGGLQGGKRLELADDFLAPTVSSQHLREKGPKSVFFTEYSPATQGA